MKKIIPILLAVIVCIGLVVFLASPAGLRTDPTTAPTISTTVPTDPTSTDEEAFNIFTKCANDYQWGENVVDILMENIPDLDMKISVVELEDPHYKITVGDAEYFMELNAESREVLTITYEGIIIFPVE